LLGKKGKGTCGGGRGGMLTISGDRPEGGKTTANVGGRAKCFLFSWGGKGLDGGDGGGGEVKTHHRGEGTNAVGARGGEAFKKAIFTAVCIILFLRRKRDLGKGSFTMTIWGKRERTGQTGGRGHVGRVYGREARSSPLIEKEGSKVERDRPLLRRGTVGRCVGRRM